MILKCDTATQFSVNCRGMAGYDPTLMNGGCSSFLASLSVPPTQAPTASPCPSLRAALGARETMGCDIPVGYHVVPPTKEQIMLAAPATGAIEERIVLNYSPPTVTWNYTGHTRITINDCPAYVLDNNVSSSGYLQQVVVDCGDGERYSVQCLTYAGFDLTLATQGCASFLGSLHMVSVPLPTPTPAPAGLVPGSAIGMPISVALVMGPWLFLIIRFLSWAWPLVFRALWPYATFRVLTVITVVAGVLSIVTQLVPFGYLVLAVWPILALAFGLEVLYRLVFRRVIFSGGSTDQPPPPPAPPTFDPPPFPPVPASPAVGYGARNPVGTRMRAPASVLHTPSQAHDATPRRRDG